MPAAPKAPPKLTELSRAYTKLVVLLGDSSGGAPTSADEVDFLIPTRIERPAGSQRVAVMSLDYLLAKDQEHIVDTLTPKAINRQVEVREVDFLGKVSRVLFWGKLAAQPLTIGQTETLSWTVRIDKHLFGDPLGKIPFSENGFFTQYFYEVDHKLVFNPEIDDKIKGNRSNREWGARNDCYLFFDAASVDTAAARSHHMQTPTKWRLYEAVHTLIWLCNPSETFIKNPSRADCSVQLGEIDIDHERLKNLSLPAGRHLPELLDALLEPFGCSWTIDVDLDPETDRSVRRFRFFLRNRGIEKELYLQRPGETLDPAKTQVPDLSLNYDIANLANKIVGCTSLMEREATFELFFCWPVSEDSLDRTELEKDPAMAKAHPHAGHKLVLNENGAWNGLRPEIIPRSIMVMDIFDNRPTISTTRKFKPCLSQVVNGDSDRLESRGIWVEWKDPSDEGKWKKATWSFSVLQLECGIWFETIPKELWEAIQNDPSSTGVRVTATIVGDTKTYATAVRDETSPNADDVTLRLNLGDKFHDRQVHSTSIFHAARATADEAYDLIQLQAYVEQVRGLEDAADLSCSATLEGIDHPEYQIGDLITKVNGRNLTLSRNNPTLGVDERYLQVVGITYDLKDSQRMELLLESFDEEKAF
ncbi:MAG: hypothetical protein V4719_26575 [Planctomycetota bacterium]